MSVRLEDLIRDGIFDIELDVTNPRTEGYSAGQGAIGVALDNTRWVKVGVNDTDWEQMFITTNGEYAANIKLSDVSGTVPDEGVIGLYNDNLTIGNGITEGGIPLTQEVSTVLQGITSHLQHTITKDEWQHSVKLVTTQNTNLPAQNNIPVSGYIKIIEFDGTTQIFGNGSFSDFQNDYTPKAFTSPYDTNLPKFYAIVPTDAGGTLDENSSIYSVEFINCGITAVDCSGLPDLERLQLSDNKITNIDLSGNTKLSWANLANNPLTNIRAKGVGAYTGGSFDIFDVSNCLLDSEALNVLFEDFVDATMTGATINIIGNPGAATCDTSIVENKGFTVVL